MNDTHKTRKYNVLIESRTVYALCVDARDEDEAEEKAWEQWESDSNKAELQSSHNEIDSVEEAAQ